MIPKRLVWNKKDPLTVNRANPIFDRVTSASDRKPARAGAPLRKIVANSLIAARTVAGRPRAINREPRCYIIESIKVPACGDGGSSGNGGGGGGGGGGGSDGDRCGMSTTAITISNVLRVQSQPRASDRRRAGRIGRRWYL